MKNIIKRGTSLLLVLAMLLSFAAVVGATDATTTTPEKILTLTVENKLLRAGQTEYLAVYEQVAGDYKINALTISATSTNSKVAVKGIYPWIPKSYSGGAWDYDYDTRETVFSSRSVGGDPIAAPPTADPLLVWTSTSGFQTSTKPLCFIKVEAQADVTPGAYQINICRNPHPEKEDDYFLFAYADPVTTEGVSQTEENATLNPGTAVVIPASAELPTVILTKTAFEAPTMATYDPEQGVDLLNYLKIVDKDGNLHDASSAADTSITGNYVSNGALKLMPSSGNSGKILVNNLHAADDASITASATLTYTVTKDTVRTPWRAGFSTYNGKYKTQADFDADFAKNPPKAPAFDGGAEFNSTSVYPNVFDQYGEVMDGYSFVPLVTLYNAADHTTPLANKAGNADPAYSAVHFNYNPTTGKWASDTLYYTKELKKDVWCKIELGVIGPDGEKANIQADTLEFLIQSQYPQAASATLELRDKNDKEFPSGPMTTIAIPWGEIPTNTYTVHVSDFRQANGEGMPTGTEPSAEEVIIALDGTYTGVSISNGNKLVIDKTAQAGTVTVKATLNGKELGKLTLTLQRAASKATDAGVYDCENKTANTNSKVLPTLSGVDADGKATLPGIREELVLTFGPGCVVDQYGEIYQVEGKDFLRPSQYALYKQSSTNPETYELCAEAERSVNAEGVVTATIKNSLDSDGNLRVQPGTYKFGTYNDNFFNGTTRFDLNQLLMSEPFELVEGETKLSGTPIYYDVETGNEPTLYVPYTYGTLDSKKATTMQVGAAIKTQYGRAYASSELPVYALSNVELNGKAIENNAVTWTNDSTGITFTVDKSAAQLFGTSNTATLTAEMTVTIGTKSTPSIPISITIKKEASVLSAVKVEMAEDTAFTTGLRTWSANRTSESKKGEVTLLSPNAKKTWYIRRTAEDQYGVEMDIQSLVTATGCSWSYDTDKATGKILYFKLGVPAGFEESFVMQFTNFTKEYKFTAKFVPMEFVKSETGKNDTFQLSDYLNRTANEDGTFSAEYNGQPWSTILAKKDGAKVYIKTAEGENNTEIPSDKLTLEVTKDGAPVGMDAKANAGSYQVKLVYTDAEGQKYTVDEKTFTITPKTVKITVTGGTITKEYDGTANLPDVTLDVTAYETLNVDKSVLKFAQENVGTDINVELTSAGTNCLKTASGEPATNYTADLSELKGTITPRKLIVTPKAKTFEYGENDKITNALTTEFDYAGKNGDLPSGLTPTITGSMVLTQNDTQVSSPYNVGDYYPRQGTLDVNSTNYEIEFKTTVNQGNVKWIVSPKTVAKFDCEELNESYGINGRELYTSLANMYVVTNANGSLKISDLYDVAKLTITGVASTGTDPVNAGMYTVSGWDAAKKTNANYSVTSPKVTITVNPHTLTSADIQSTDNWGAKDFTGEEQTFTAFKVSFTYNERTIDLVENQDYVIVNNSNKGIYSVVTLRIKAADGSTNYTGEARAPQSWSIRAFKVRTGDLEIYQTNTLTYDGTPKTAEFAVRVISTDQTRQKVLNHFTIANNYGEMWGDTQTDAGSYTAGGSFARGFSIGDEGVNTFTWTIGKSDKTPIQNQTANTKYGQPGSAEISVSDGAAKGLDTSKLSVSIVTDTDNIISGTPSVKFENGKITVNWQLQGDATTIDKTAKLRVTVAETDNYKQYTFDVDVTVTAKTPQTNFGFTTATDATVGYAEDTYTNPVQNAKTTPVYMSSNESVATVDSNGVVTIKDVGENVTITATAPENGEYASATASYTLTVVPSTLTVTASSATMTANDSVPSFTASVTGLKRGQATSQVFQTLTASAATDGKTAGTYAVNASATLKTDFVPRYTLRFVPGTLTVNPAVTVIDTVLPIIIGGNTCANGYANCACESFYDLDASRWYHEAIDWAYSLGLMNGTTKSTFGPNAAATRAQTWTMLARIAGQDTRRSSTWYEVGQKWAMNLGITDGTNPMGSLTREQLAAMLYRYVGSPAVNGTLTFTDSANVSAWARNAMIWAVQNGILDGVGGNRLNPKGTTTRAQAAAIFMRFSKLINK
mgnify:CR=1 FL=1